jgi:hypothetical protein
MLVHIIYIKIIHKICEHTLHQLSYRVSVELLDKVKKSLTYI